MNKFRLLWIVCGLLMLAGCTDTADNSARTIELKNFSNTGCKNDHVRTRSDNTNKEVFNYSCIHEGYLYVTHQNAIFNCCPIGLGAKISVEDNLLKVVEYESDGLCDCMCPFDLSYEVGPLVEGKTYILYVSQGGEESKVAEFEFQNSMTGEWERK